MIINADVFMMKHCGNDLFLTLKKKIFRKIFRFKIKTQQMHNYDNYNCFLRYKNFINIVTIRTL